MKDHEMYYMPKEEEKEGWGFVKVAVIVFLISLAIHLIFENHIDYWSQLASVWLM